MAAVGRGGGGRLSSGGAASAPFGPTEKPILQLICSLRSALHILFNQQTSPMRLCATTKKASFVFDLTSYIINLAESYMPIAAGTFAEPT
jgi:hypothetical protein